MLHGNPDPKSAKSFSVEALEALKIVEKALNLAILKQINYNQNGLCGYFLLIIHRLPVFGRREY